MKVALFITNINHHNRTFLKKRKTSIHKLTHKQRQREIVGEFEGMTRPCIMHQKKCNFFFIHKDKI